MPVKRIRRNIAYGLNNPLQRLAPEPIILTRDPVPHDEALEGTIAINRLTNAYFVATGQDSSGTIWTAQATGSGTFASVDVTGTSGTVLQVASGGDTDLGGDLAVAGNSVLAGNLTVTGDTVINGDFDISSASAISFISTANTANAIEFETNGGTSETMTFTVAQGTAAGSLALASIAGGITATSGLASSTAIDLTASVGGFALNGVLTSSVNVTGAGQDIQLNATGGSIAATATESTAGAVTIAASGASGTILLQGTGGISLTATNNAISIQSGSGATNISTAATANTTTIGNVTAGSAVVINSGTGGVAVNSTGTGDITLTAADGLSLLSSGVTTITCGPTSFVDISNDTRIAGLNIGTGAALKAVTVGSTNTTSSTTIQSGTGDLAMTSTDAITLDAVGVLELNSSAGNIGIGNDAVAALINIGTGASNRDITIGNVTASTTIVLNTPTGTPVQATQGILITTAGAGVTVGTAGPQLLAGAGSPNGAVTAPAGSMYMRTDPAGATSRIYVNTDSATTWTNVTCAA